MCNSRQIDYFPIRLFRDIDEPVICSKNAIFIQNSNNGSKITIYNIETGKAKSIATKHTLYFNVCADKTNVAFEFSGNKRGIGIINTDTMELTEVDDIGSDIILGGIWDNYIVFRRGFDIVLYNINKRTERVIASCRHILGAPIVGCGICAWLQLYRDKCCVMFYDIRSDKNLILSSPGYINKMYAIEEYVVYQNCSNNKCSIYTYNFNNGQLKKVFQSTEWIELYRGRNGTIVWTVRKENQTEYMFDVWIYNIEKNKVLKILSDCRNVVIPTVSDEIAVWVDSGIKGDNLYLMPIEQ